MIQEVASQFWQNLPVLASEPEPKFSSGWLDDFKKQHRIKKYRQHGEAGSADHTGSEARIIELRKIVDEYAMKNTYNMDKAALYWKMTPDVTLATERQNNIKKEKT